MKVKLKAKAVEQKSGFEPYDGPEPNKRGFYRAAIKKFQFGKKNSGSMGFFIVLELESAKGDPKDHAKFDGYPMFSRNIITESSDGAALKEGAQRNLSNLLAALGTGDDPDVVLAKDGDPSEGMVDVLKIGSKKPVGAIVNIDMDFEIYQDEKRPSVGGIYKFKEEAGSAKGKPSFTEDEDDDEDDEDDEADLMASDEEASEVDERSAELDEMSVAALRKLAKELGVKSSGTKEIVIEAILDAEFPEDGDDESDEDDEESDEEDEVDDTEEDEAEEEDDEAEDEDDEESARLEELQNFDRAALKKILKGVAKDFTVLKRHSDDDLREAIINAEFGEDTPF